MLVENHRAFLRFLDRRSPKHTVEPRHQPLVGDVREPVQVSREGVLQEVLGQRPVADASLDRHRRKGAEDRALAAFTQELADPARPDELYREICACVGRLASTLKPEYAEVLQAVDVEDTPVKAFAETAGLTASNAGVRLFRAREALRKQVTASCGTCVEHGCLDCSCEKP